VKLVPGVMNTLAPGSMVSVTPLDTVRLLVTL
jgi:hypothetical protein